MDCGFHEYDQILPADKPCAQKAKDIVIETVEKDKGSTFAALEEAGFTVEPVVNYNTVFSEDEAIVTIVKNSEGRTVANLTHRPLREIE